VRKVVVTLAASFLVVGSVFALVYLLTPLWHKCKFKRESVRLLCAAQSVEELQEVVAPLGIVFQFPDGSWIAIRYTDSHAWRAWSKAIAMDNLGRLYESDFHFCGSFAIYRQQKERYEDINELAPEEKRSGPQFAGILRQIDSLASSPNLAVARKQLPSLGFETFQGIDCSQNRASQESDALRK